jgi:glycosidase
MLALTRRLIGWRRREPALRSGGFETLRAEGDLLVFRRQHEARAVLCAFNLGNEPLQHRFAASLDADPTRTVALNGADCDGAALCLPARAAWIAPL